MKRVLLAGAGHAHLEVLRRLAIRPLPGAAVTVITPNGAARYSGMLPGAVAGHYRPEDLLIPVAPLAARAGATLVQEAVVGLDAEGRRVRLAGGTSFGFDLLALDIGAASDLRGAPDDDSRLLPVKPLDAFLSGLDAAETRFPRRRPARVVVAGGGVAGVEMALALRHRYARAGRAAAITVIERGPAILPGLAPGARRRLEAALARHDISVKIDTAAAPDGDLLVWATGAAAPEWLPATGLALDPRGFVRVDAGLRSVSHDRILAVGDVASLPSPRPKAGVFAVRQGPVLYENLRRSLEGVPLRRYRPQRAWLHLITTGPRHAVAARGGFSFSGALVWWWKDRIDRRFVGRYRDP